MNRLLFLLALPLGACTMASGERVYAQGNYEYLEWHGGSRPSLVLVKANHSTPIRAVGSVIGTAGTAATGIATAVMTRGLVR